MTTLKRQRYAALYGPTTGDRVRLGDTDLWVRVDRDLNAYGDELLAGQGKTMRDGMLASNRLSPGSAMDCVITNVLIVDPRLGVCKGNIGIKAGRIAGVGRAGNPAVMDGVDLPVATTTAILPGEGLIATPGGVDTHVHLITPRLFSEALSAGVTTLIAAGPGGVFDVGANPRYYLQRMMEAIESVPLNIGFVTRGSSSNPDPLRDMVEAGACTLKVHEDFGATPAVLDAALRVADEMDVQVCLHTDGLNESGCLPETLAAIGGRTVHAFHVEGAGGGHVPDTLAMVGRPGVLSSSTTPSFPYTVATDAEHLAMIMTVHRLNPTLPEDRALALGRIRTATLAAEGVLHDMGAIAITTSDSQGMGRIGETIRRTWQLAHRMRELDPSAPANQNDRILRYIAKYTINPAIAHGISHHVGSLEAGKIADIVLWRPAFFGVRPEFVLKSGFVVWAVLGEGNGSTRICQPLSYGPMFGAMGNAAAELSVTFVSQAFMIQPQSTRPRTRRRLLAVRGTRSIGPAEMVHNSAAPQVDVDPSGQTVRVNGRPVEIPPAEQVPLNQLYVLG